MKHSIVFTLLLLAVSITAGEDSCRCFTSSDGDTTWLDCDDYGIIWDQAAPDGFVKRLCRPISKLDYLLEHIEIDSIGRIWFTVPIGIRDDLPSDSTRDPYGPVYIIWDRRKHNYGVTLRESPENYKGGIDSANYIIGAVGIIGSKQVE